MTTTGNTWVELYLSGCELEWSIDNQDWMPVIEEPYAGDGRYYREKVKNKNESYYIPGKPE